MNKILLALIIVFVIIILVGVYLIYYKNPTINQPQSQAQPTDNTISIKNFAFSPGTITIKSGTTVTWLNEDSAPHTIKFATFNSNILNNGATFQFTFNDAGTYDYYCAIHPSMKGKIIVTN